MNYIVYVTFKNDEMLMKNGYDFQLSVNKQRNKKKGQQRREDKCRDIANPSLAQGQNTKNP